MDETETELLPRMRIARGRVMHVVEEFGQGWIRSVCRRYKTRPNGPRRAYGAASEWSASDLGYPDCPRCPSHPLDGVL